MTADRITLRPETRVELCTAIRSFARTDVALWDAADDQPCNVAIELTEAPDISCGVRIQRGYVDAEVTTVPHEPTIRTNWRHLAAFLYGECSYAELLMNGQWRLKKHEGGCEADPCIITTALERWARCVRSPHNPPPDLRATTARCSAALAPMTAVDRLRDVYRDIFVKQYVRRGCPAVLERACREWRWEELIEAYDGTETRMDGALVVVSDTLRDVAAGKPLAHTLSLPLSRQIRKNHRGHALLDAFQFFEAARRLIVAYADATPVGSGYRHATVWHCDLADNFLAQLTGSKRVSLVAPHNRDAMMVERTIPAVVDNVEWDVAGCEPREVPVIACTLEAGDILFLPAGWFHDVTNLTPSCVMTSWVLGVREDCA